jgi:hypothetical protein
MAVNFFWAPVNHLLGELNVMIKVSNKNLEHVARFGADHPGIKSDPKLPEAIRQSVETIEFIVPTTEKHFAHLKCEHINRAAKALAYWPKLTQNEWSELNARSRALRDAIQTELKQYYYYQYPRQKGEKLYAWKDDWKRTVAAFPATKRDIFDATDCYALGHSTASVFHSMRVTEHGLRALALERKVRLPKNKQVEWATWQEIIKALDDEIKLIGTAKKAGAAKDAALEFYSGARADLNGFKDEYRNQVSHVRATYDDLQALRALNNVNAFMERIAVKIDKNHHRIRWGLR